MEVLDKDVSNARTTHAGVTLAPHNTARTTLDHGEVHGVKSTLCVSYLMVVDVGISQRATSDGIAAHTDGRHGSDGIEHFKKKSLVHIERKVSDVKRCRMEGLRRSWALASTGHRRRNRRSGCHRGRGCVTTSGRSRIRCGHFGSGFNNRSRHDYFLLFSIKGKLKGERGRNDSEVSQLGCRRGLLTRKNSYSKELASNVFSYRVSA
mmetsp:Transcript_22327/g.32827  ORF Transcript_22327/g.32827 Transcript_22327/m.32827 type:complete len:207 (-) Transcript_22327:102-722(-)